VQATLVLYESPKRLAALLAEMAGHLGADPAGRGLPRADQALRGSDARHVWPTLAGQVARPGEIKGEIVLVVDRAPPAGSDRRNHRRGAGYGAANDVR
jgi:16S rRNA C1402 (ribose-2'-O) methylase RsmI